MGFFDKIKEGAAKAADKAKDSVEVVRLNSQIAGKRKEIENYQQQIGEAIFEAYKLNDLSSVEPMIHTKCQAILALQQEIEDIEVKVRTLKDEKDCVCGQILPLNAKFCSSCGHRFEFQPVVVDTATSEEGDVVYGTVIEPQVHQENGETVVIASQMIQCESCQEQLPSDARFCENCGKQAY